MVFAYDNNLAFFHLADGFDVKMILGRLWLAYTEL